MNPSVRKTKVFFWSLAVSAGFIQAWGYRFYIEPDGVNYLDVADAYRRGDWSSAINGYWSPLYSWLLMLVRVALSSVPILGVDISAFVEFRLVLVGALLFRVFLWPIAAAFESGISRGNG